MAIGAKFQIPNRRALLKNPRIICLLFLVIGCGLSSDKQYQDYDPDNFIEVQGIITRVFHRSVYPDKRVTDLRFIYQLDSAAPKQNMERGTPFLLNDGDPAVILVHKDDNDISFFGSRGIIDEEQLLRYLAKCEAIGGGYFGIDQP